MLDASIGLYVLCETLKKKNRGSIFGIRKLLQYKAHGVVWTKKCLLAWLTHKDKVNHESASSSHTVVAEYC